MSENNKNNEVLNKNLNKDKKINKDDKNDEIKDL